MTPAHVAVELERWVDPADAFVAQFAARSDTFWLDAGHGASAGWSLMGAGSPAVDPGAARGVHAGGRSRTDDIPGPFGGGWIGWFGYDAAARRSGASAAEETADAALLRVDSFLVFDHAARRAWAVAPTVGEATESATRAEGAPTGAASASVRIAEPARGTAHSRDSPAHYRELIAQCRSEIREGNAYQLCLTTRFEVDGAVDPLRAHLRLRQATPAHHGGLLRIGDTALVSASPEVFLECSGGVVRTRPIKGTRPRGHDAHADARLSAELESHPKERAENVMIVDLMRNDLSRICRDGTVAADALLRVETYPAVHQLVSTVSGELREDITVGDILDATFPAGSMTGAPKLSAMTILHRLERAPRGLFAGCFGWIADSGDLDLAMVIRSIVTHPGGAYVGAGGGITWHSDADAEVFEVGVKARAPLAALGAVTPAGWQASETER